METYKIVLIGPSGVGKSALLRCVTNDPFEYRYVSTIGVDFKTTVIFAKYKNVKLRIWDTAGQDRFRSIIKSYYRKAHCMVCVFDLCSSESFTCLQDMVKDIQQDGCDSDLWVLVGNKKDLCAKNRQVSQTDANMFADEHDMLYFETSAKTSSNVNCLFRTIANQLVQDNVRPLDNVVVIRDPLEPINITVRRCC